MDLFYYCVLFWIPGLMLAMGLTFLFKKDWSWTITEWMLRYVNPQRTPEWERSTNQKGVVLVVGGVITTLYIIFKIL